MRALSGDETLPAKAHSPCHVMFSRMVQGPVSFKASQATHSAGTSLRGSREANKAISGWFFTEFVDLYIYLYCYFLLTDSLRLIVS